MRPLALLLALPLVLACAEPPQRELAGSRWTFEKIDGVKPVGRSTSLSFESGRLGANVGCNGMGGEWKVEQDRIVVDGIISTMMFCDGVMDQERAVADLLGGKPTYAVTGNRLTLRSGTHSAELVRAR